jgi:hypothetical protein
MFGTVKPCSSLSVANAPVSDCSMFGGTRLIAVLRSRLTDVTKWSSVDIGATAGSLEGALHYAAVDAQCCAGCR